MHYAISTKVLDQTHMWYTPRQAIKLFEDFSIFMGFWIFEHTQKQNKRSKINKNKYKSELVKETCSKQKTMHDMMHEPMNLNIGSINARI